MHFMQVMHKSALPFTAVSGSCDPLSHLTCQKPTLSVLLVPSPVSHCSNYPHFRDPMDTSGPFQSSKKKIFLDSWGSASARCPRDPVSVFLLKYADPRIAVANCNQPFSWLVDPD